jgi:hypothetical protein
MLLLDLPLLNTKSFSLLPKLIALGLELLVEDKDGIPLSIAVRSELLMEEMEGFYLLPKLVTVRREKSESLLILPKLITFRFKLLLGLTKQISVGIELLKLAINHFPVLL